ncbi:MAG: DUF2167 domain-containing protein [Vicinamibacteria bacterium]|jgi:uncharacterized membrane-anchored protein|nr:DUF2167 domain-containing protein [Vicinamibacteria bacterium]
MSINRRVSTGWLWISLLVISAAQGVLAQDMPRPNWVAGPKTVDLGSDVAQVQLEEGYLFAGPADTRRVLEAMGNRTDGSEVGMIMPRIEGQEWFMIFEWSAEGYVKDDDKDQIDKDAILKSYQEGTEAANEERRKRGIPGLHVVGWYEEPHYDTRTHNLVWAMLAKDDKGEQSVNYNVRLLGREGYMSLTLVDEPAKLTQSKPYVEKMIGNFSYKSGKTYAEFKPGDKIAKYGLAALVAGGGAAAAAKLGLFGVLFKFLGKAWKLVVVGFLVVVAFIKRIFNAIRGKSDE